MTDLPTIKDLPNGIIHDYRKVPVVIQAVQWDGTMYLADFLHQWSRGDVFFDHTAGYLTCKTLEGLYFEAILGAWVICGVEGEFYFCQDSIFKKTYEEVA